LVTFGLLEGTVIVLAYTDRRKGPHIISLRKAEKYEARYYFEIAKTMNYARLWKKVQLRAQRGRAQKRLAPVSANVEAVEKPLFKPKKPLQTARFPSRHSSFRRRIYRIAVPPAPK